MIMHLDFWQRALVDLLGPSWGHFAYTMIDHESIGHRLIDTIRSELRDAPLAAYPERTQGIGYYRTVAVKIMARTEADELEIGDGGFCRMDCRADSGRERALSDLLRSSGAACRFDPVGRSSTRIPIILGSTRSAGNFSVAA